MANETVLQNWIFTDYILPFLLVFTLIFAILSKTKVLGGKKQLDAIVSFVVALIFTGFAAQKLFVGNMVVFLAVALIIVFIFLLLWGFIAGGEIKFEGAGLKWTVGIVLVIVIGIAILWASGIESQFYDLLFNQDWSMKFWTNVVFIGVGILAVWVVLKNSS